MKQMPRLALIHATRVAIDPIETAARDLWPEAETVTILEEGLSADRQKSDELSLDLWDRIVGLAQYAENLGASGILFTCSAFGQAIEDAADGARVPVMKPNEAMFDAAFAHGDNIAMIYTFEPAAPGMKEEFKEAAAARGSSARLSTYFAEGALDAKRAGDDATHNRLIAETAQKITGADAILLAQFSMAGAADEVRDVTDVPVLTSPEAAIAEIKRRVETQKGEA
ncbi:MULTISPECIES: aspartate/glutamate racemase family protein [unclassified Ruegeria]|uniref:aspartate/glutamate racemase family protein n=1 Tax=unclassified Ruegeria TaxID=2625375 RepID=UPI001487DD1F|nr:MULTISPECIES: aspartate/glutamate racemase family protein [unclassified Ruegeria]